MSTLTIPQVRAWRPEQLDTAAQTVGEASDKIETQVTQVRTTLEQALTEAGGRWARVAAERAADEAKTGVQLADALDLARTALKNGATDIGTARTKLLQTISAAEGEGFTVANDGAVTPPTLPPVMTSPEGAADALEERNKKQQSLNLRAQEIADDLGAGLSAAATADGQTATALGRIEIPQTLESAVEAYIERALSSKDLLGALGGAGAGGVALALTLKKAIGIFGKSSAFLKFLKSSSAPITDYQTFLKNMGAADDAIKELASGKANGGFARFLLGSKAAKLAGKVFLPLTVLTGAVDVFTGGGYDGARGWASRGFGLAAVGGGGALLASGAGLVALGPVGLAIAGGAVLAYGAWSLGNYVYDNWDDIKEFGGKALNWTGDRLEDLGKAQQEAVNWGKDRVNDAVEGVKDLGKKGLSTVTFGLL